jgi:RNA polymerase sigma-70 factor (ECF subfamily)
LPDRLDAVLTVVHLLYTTGHTAPGGDNLVRADLVDRAIGVARMLRTLMPDEREVAGLLALILLTDARRATRADPQGRLLLLEDQDRSQWDRSVIAEGTALVPWALRGGRPGRFALQAAIAALHAEAPSYAQTDWPQIVALYDALLRVWSSPVVALNRAVAVAMAQGPAAGLAQIGELEADGRLGSYRYLPATKADLLRRLGRWDAAAQAYREALALTDNAAEREFLARRLTEVTGQPG